VDTAHLIDLLAQDAPVNWRLSSRLAVAFAVGAAIAAIIFVFGIGVRPDIAAAGHTMRVQFKFVFTLTLLSGAAGAVAQAGRPDSTLGPWALRPWILRPWILESWFRGRWAFVLAIAPVLLGLAVVAELVATPAQSWMSRLTGQNAMYCLTLIPALALAPLACLLIALRESAPERPEQAGAVAGLAAGGIAAVLYASHCPDDSPLFVAVWYSLAIAVVAAAGYCAGARLLKW
jgi:hypothetical protein